MSVYIALQMFLFFQAATYHAPAQYAWPADPITQDQYEFCVKAMRSNVHRGSR